MAMMARGGHSTRLQSTNVISAMTLPSKIKSLLTIVMFGLGLAGLASCQTMRPTGVTLKGKAIWTVPTTDVGLLEIRVFDRIADNEGRASVGIGTAMMVLSGQTMANFSITLDKGFYAQCVASADCKAYLRLRDQMDLEIEGLYLLARGEAPIRAGEALVVVMEDIEPEPVHHLSSKKN